MKRVVFSLILLTISLSISTAQVVEDVNKKPLKDVLNDIQNRYQEYRALPEEQDAWRTGDSLPCGAP